MHLAQKSTQFGRREELQQEGQYSSQERKPENINNVVLAREIADEKKGFIARGEVLLLDYLLSENLLQFFTNIDEEDIDVKE